MTVSHGQVTYQTVYIRKCMNGGKRNILEVSLKL